MAEEELSSCVDCCICCDPLFCNGKSIGVLACGHPFHHDCVTHWFNKKRGNKKEKKFSCPVCRRDLKMSHQFEEMPVVKLVLPSSIEEMNSSTEALQELGELRVEVLQLRKKNNDWEERCTKLQAKENELCEEKQSLTNQVAQLHDKCGKLRKEANRVPELQKQNEKFKQEYQKLKTYKLSVDLMNCNVQDTKLGVKKLLDVNADAESALEQVYAINENNKRLRIKMEKQVKELEAELKQLQAENNKYNENGTHRNEGLRRQLTDDGFRKPLVTIQRKPMPFSNFSSGFEIDDNLESLNSKPAGLHRTKFVQRRDVVTEGVMRGQSFDV